jgi:ubiquinone/menaquinone biosynthesis C-methylase UbiE
MTSFFERRHLKAFKADIDQILPALDAGNAKSLLDVGGGTGVLTLALATGIAWAVVVEPNGRKRAKGARRRPSVAFLEGGAEKLPAADGSFDRVISFVAFHHFHDQPAALREMKRVMSAGGRLLLFEFRPEAAPGPCWRLFAGHTHFLRAEDLVRMVAEAGFRDARATETEHGYFVFALRP